MISESEIYTCEVRTTHLHAAGKELQVGAEVWHDGLYHLSAVDFFGVVNRFSLTGAKELRTRLLAQGIPESDIRITHTTYRVLSATELM